MTGWWFSPGIRVPSNKTDRHDITEVFRALTTFKLEGEVTYLSESSLGGVEDNREKWGD